MDKLTHTTAEFDKAIRKVNKDYADVTEVDATASDVVSGRKIVGANKEIITGSIGTASLRPAISIDGSVVGETVSPYEISGEASLEVTESGYVSSVTPGESVTRYIKTEEKQGTPSYDNQVVLEAAEGKFLSKVTVEKTPDFVSKVKQVPIFEFYLNQIKTGTGYGGLISAGTTEDNVYCTKAIADCAVYLIPIPLNVGAQKITFTIIDIDTGRLPNGTVVLKAGDSFTSTATTYSPGGVLTFTTTGRLQFYHTSSIKILSGFSSCPMMMYKDGVYYLVCVDYNKFSHGYVGYGSRTTGGLYSSPNNAETVFNAIVGYRDYVKPMCVFGNLANVYWTGHVYSASETRYTSEYPRMTFNYGSGRSIIAEVEDG